MRLLIGARTIKQSAISLPIKPSGIEWPASVANEARLVRARLLDFDRVEICLNPRLQLAEVDIDQERVAASLDSWKRYREQFG